MTRGSLIAGRYRILAPLGRGGMGAVYRARDEVLDDEVALKILRPEVAGTPEMAARFRSEIKLARKVSHWNVCRIHEYGEDGGLQYISMELISGSHAEGPPARRAPARGRGVRRRRSRSRRAWPPSTRSGSSIATSSRPT